MTRPRPKPTRRSGRPDAGSTVQAVRALIAAMGRSARVVEQRTGLTNAQVFLLREIAAHGPLSVNDLTARVLTNQSTVSTLAARLYQRGLVRRGRSPDDGRRSILSISDAGRRLLRRAPAPPLAKLLRALQALRPAEQRALSLGLGALLRELGVHPEAAPPMFEAGARTRGAVG